VNEVEFLNILKASSTIWFKRFSKIEDFSYGLINIFFINIIVDNVNKISTLSIIIYLQSIFMSVLLNFLTCLQIHTDNFIMCTLEEKLIMFDS